MNFPNFSLRKKNDDGTARSSSVRSKSSEGKRRRTLIVQDGLLILAVAALLVFNAAARGINLLMALGAFFVGFLAVDYFWGKRVLRDLNVTRRLPDSAYVGEPFYVEIEVDAAKRSSSAWALVVEDSWTNEEAEYDAPARLKKSEAAKEAAREKDAIRAVRKDRKAQREAKLRAAEKARRSGKNAKTTDAALHEGVETLNPVVYFPNVPKREKRKEYYVGVFTRRGVRRMKTLTVSTRFPCGFFRSSERFERPDEILVFPRIGRLTSVWESTAGKVAEEASVSTSLTSNIPDETVAIRDWRPGDSKRTIAWRATAKRNRLQARDFTKRQSRAIVLILDLYRSQSRAKEDAAQSWRVVETAISFAATLIKRYTEGDSQLYFALNADVPEFVSERKQGKKNAWNDAPDDWDAIVGGGTTRRAFSRLALAIPPKEDRLLETIRAAKAFNLTDAQVFVVSVEPIGNKRLGGEPWKEARFIDASSTEFESYFSYNASLDGDFSK